LLVPGFVAAQEAGKSDTKVEAAPIAVYHLDYVIRELDSGKVINQRKYSLSVEGSGRRESGHVRVGRRVPVAVAGTAAGPNPQYTYMDVGLNLDCNLQEQADGLLLQTMVEMSSVVTGGELAAPGVPVTRQARASMASLLTLGKPTVIGTLDDVDSTHTYQIEVTATRMK
ncbi:MAG TPA: hypothetical protein VEH31_07285, partial [Streptosporangiaceae bacterium]|nr:hypothetical protein [Streptosporangiaceae bacterium]